VFVADCVVNGPALLGGFENARTCEEGEVAGDDGEIDGAALGDLTDGAGASALGDAGQEEDAGGIGEGLEELGVEEIIDGGAAGGGESRGGGDRGARAADRGGRGGGSLAYLRHHASIATDPIAVK
jgi:hypothetical protein